MRNIAAIERQIDEIFNTVAREAAALGASISSVNPDRLFSFDDYPQTKDRLNKLLQGLNKKLQASIVNGIRSGWTLSNNKNNELSRQVFGDNVGKLSQQAYRRYFSTNDDARKAFEERKTNGLKISDRVWNYTTGFKDEIELGLDVSIRNGMSADDMTKELRQYLKYPDKLFRRVRDEHGNLQLSKAAAAFHPGQGVYRSSYKNARRLAATETNMAYRTSDHLRWQQADYVVGIRVVLSNNHTLLGRDGKPHRFTDICDELSAPLDFTPEEMKGLYPKDFKFVGWHPHCRCHALSVLKTPEEMKEDTKRILAGEETTNESVNKVTDVPQEFKSWLTDNAERSKRVYSTPYFVTDNMKYIPKKLWTAYGSKLPYPSFAEYEEAMKYNRQHSTFSKEQLANIKELNSELPVIQGQIMHFGSANMGTNNPNYKLPNAEDLGYLHNCQTCTVSYELRRRGFDVESMPNKIYLEGTEVRDIDVFFNKNKMKWTDRFLNTDGTPVKYNWSDKLGKDASTEAKKTFIESQISEQGRYEVYCAWKGGNAHVYTVERKKNGELLWYDPQNSRRNDEIENYIDRMKSELIAVVRIDDKLINPKFAKRLLRHKS